MAITKTNCPPVNTCDACKEIVNSNCVKYSGANITCAGITNGSTLTNIIVDLASSICELSALSADCSCTPQACVKLHKTGEYEVKDSEFASYYNFFSCSVTSTPAGCTKTYKIFTTNLDTEIFAGSITECYDYRVDLVEGIEYYIVEYITCGSVTSESTNQTFGVHVDELLGTLVIIAPLAV